MHTDSELLRQELSSHFLAPQNADREGRTSGSSAGVSASSASGAASVSSSNSGSSSRTVQAQTSMPPLAYQFHQHNHQHQHTHTHQHFLHPPAAAPPMVRRLQVPVTHFRIALVKAFFFFCIHVVSRISTSLLNDFYFCSSLRNLQAR